MKYFVLLLAACYKVLLRSVGLRVTAVFFVALTVIFGLVIPHSKPQPMSVGLYIQEDIGNAVVELLLQNNDYDFVLYDTEQLLRRDVITGVLHCGYTFAGDKAPITALVTAQAYMKPLLDELVVSAWNQAQTADTVQQFLDESSLGGDARSLLAEQQPRPMAIEIVQNGQSHAQPVQQQSPMQPLLYAVMISAFLATALLSAMLLPDSEHRALAQLAAFSGHAAATHAAHAVAWVSVNLAILVFADSMVSWMLGDAAYPLATRIPMLVLLATVTLVFVYLGDLLRRHAELVTMLLAPAVMVGVLFSGALVSPDRILARLGWLRWLSPAWYFLKMLQ